MIFNYPKQLLALSIFLMLLGIALPFLMVIHLLESTFFLNFFSYAASTVGIFLGFISFAATRIKSNREQNKSVKDNYFDPPEK